jgi:P27 family predicted phage terminase small subunit
MAGRPPKPTAIKRLAGNPGKRKLNEAEPKFELAIPRPPRHLDPVAKAEWRRVSRELFDAGLLTRVDRAALAAYCQAWSTWVDAVKRLREEGQTIISDKGYVYQHPLVAIRDKAVEQMRRFMVEFGMTPSSRSRVKAEKPETVDELERILFGQDVKVVNDGGA